MVGAPNSFCRSLPAQKPCFVHLWRTLIYAAIQPKMDWRVLPVRADRHRRGNPHQHGCHPLSSSVVSALLSYTYHSKGQHSSTALFSGHQKYLSPSQRNYPSRIDRLRLNWSELENLQPSLPYFSFERGLAYFFCCCLILLTGFNTQKWMKLSKLSLTDTKSLRLPSVNNVLAGLMWVWK